MIRRKKLIEVALPLDAINKASAREKSIRHGHPSTLHLWWARRPLAAARAVIFAQMVDDPSSHPDIFRTEKEQEKERQRLFKIIEDLVQWENTNNEEVLERARAEIWQSWRAACADNADHPRAKELFDRHKLPAFHDPFAGGGSLPLEAQRLGLEAYASDLNPVAVLINKAMIEIPPKFANQPPVNPEYRKSLLATPLGAPASPPALSSSNLSSSSPWRSRGYLPHFDEPRRLQSLTFRLHDAVPDSVIQSWKTELSIVENLPATDPREVQLRKLIARYEDAGHGACWLRDERIASLVENALLHFDDERYRLLAWCIMPNHVHVLVETFEAWPLASIVHSWKSYTAHAANEILGRSGEFWFREYHDRFIRDDDHFAKAVRYIEHNPVKAGLVRLREEWRWSSAWWQKDEPEAKDSKKKQKSEKKSAGTTPALSGQGLWRGAQGLAEDVRYYGKWMRDEAEKRIGHLYPKVEVTEEMAADRPDLKPYVGKDLTIIAWIWARTVKSPNPAFAHVDVPLASTFMLSTKQGRETYVEPVIEDDRYRFTVKVGKPKDQEVAKNGTKLARGANFRCILSGAPVSADYIRLQAQGHRMGARLMAIVAESERGRMYLPPTQRMEEVARSATPEWKPDVEFFQQALGFRVGNYGMEKWSDLFTSRQLIALTTFSDLVNEACELVKHDAVTAGLSDDTHNLDTGGSGATAYAEAVTVYLGMAVSKLADTQSSLCRWKPTMDQSIATFGRQALPMVWDYSEANVFGEMAGDLLVSLKNMMRVIDQIPMGLAGHGYQSDAQSQTLSKSAVVSTDPPYYDNVGYADLSDFFYVWLRRSLRSIFPGLFATVGTPKVGELVATPERHGSKRQAEAFFLAGMTQAMYRLAEQAHPAFPVTVYYAFKQSESDGDAGISSTGWETFLDAVIRAGFATSGTWPIRTELGNRMRGMESNALASSIVLVCHPRAASAPTVTRREFLDALKSELPGALRHLQRGNIAPVDLAQAAIGPGMAVFTRYFEVLDAEGNPLSVRQALALINQVLDEVLTEQEGDFDTDSRWALAWFEQSGFGEGAYGVAETLSKAKNTSVSGMAGADILVSKGGKVRLLRPEELPQNWDPTRDSRLTVWEMVHHTIRVLEAEGEGAAADLVAKLGTRAEVARELAYRLYSICERKKRAQEALSYNNLVQSWPEILRLAREAGAQAAKQQAEMFG